MPKAVAKKSSSRTKRPKKSKDYYLSPEELAIGTALIEARAEEPPPVIKYRTLLRWENNIPYLTSAPERLSTDPTALIPELIRKVLDMPYHGDNPAFEGLSFGEAMVISMAREAADGSDAARTAILDRLLGKPKQSIESVQITGTLNDFLDGVAKSELHTTIDVPSNPSTPNDSSEDL